MRSHFTAAIFLILVLLVGTSAYAQPQTALCSPTVNGVNQLINQHFNKFKANFASRFLGTWKRDDSKISLSISSNRQVTAKGYGIVFCPQDDGTIYFHVSGYPQIGGFVYKKKGNRMVVTAQSHHIVPVAGTYLKQ